MFRIGLLALMKLVLGLSSLAAFPAYAADRAPAPPILQIMPFLCPVDYAGTDFERDCTGSALRSRVSTWRFTVGGDGQYIAPIYEDLIWELDPNGPDELAVTITAPRDTIIWPLVIACENIHGRPIESRSRPGANLNELIVTLDLPDRRGAYCNFYFTPLSDQPSLMTLFAIGCDADPGRVGNSDAAAFPPPGCAPQAGVTLTATTGDARPLGTCLTGADGTCVIAVPAGEIILREDLATVPPGYEPIANPVLLRQTQAPPGIVNVREGALVRPAGTASLTVHSRVCPLEYIGSDYYGDCHGTIPDFAQTIFLIGEQGGPDARSAEIDANGNVAFDGLAAESYTLIAGQSRLVARTVVFCSRAYSPGVEYPAAAVPGAWGAKTVVALDDGAAIVCDLYVIPADRVNG